MHNCIISGASCYPCGAVVEKVEGTDEEFCRYLLSEEFFLLFQTLLWVFSHILDISAWIFPSPWNEPVFLCSVSCWSLKLFNSWVIAQLLSLFSVLPVSNPNPSSLLWDPKCKLGFHHVHWAFFQGVKQEYKSSFAGVRAKPCLNQYCCFGYHQ